MLEENCITSGPVHRSKLAHQDRGTSLEALLLNHDAQPGLATISHICKNLLRVRTVQIYTCRSDLLSLILPSPSNPVTLSINSR